MDCMPLYSVDTLERKTHMRRLQKYSIGRNLRYRNIYIQNADIHMNKENSRKEIFELELTKSKMRMRLEDPSDKILNLARMILVAIFIIVLGTIVVTITLL